MGWKCDNFSVALSGIPYVPVHQVNSLRTWAAVVDAGTAAVQIVG